MHFANVAEALCYLRSADGGSLRIQHTQVARPPKPTPLGTGTPSPSRNHHPSWWLPPRARSAHQRHPRSICQRSVSRASSVLAAVQTFAAPSTHAGGATGLLMRHACNLWKDWYNIFHILVVHVGTSWHPTPLNVMHVISVCIPLAPLMVFVRGVPRGSPRRLTLFLSHVSSPPCMAVDPPMVAVRSPVCAHVVRGVPCPSTAWELRAFRARNFQLQIVHC